ncbi:hypothetical protein FA95DRAFT_1575732 [Auriscalpium vulgare]|uniref:Uncharacterized protein n=1 Tax=Auriscalpium vulgare TaxID=40419 RepID=A0ACB8REF1_9AGAM|nr:hypothetical protein FA95DRAFT_1575732 [Auriscalpium vulgare]
MPPASCVYPLLHTAPAAPYVFVIPSHLLAPHPLAHALAIIAQDTEAQGTQFTTQAKHHGRRDVRRRQQTCPALLALEVAALKPIHLIDRPVQCLRVQTSNRPLGSVARGPRTSAASFQQDCQAIGPDCTHLVAGGLRIAEGKLVEIWPFAHFQLKTGLNTQCTGTGSRGLMLCPVSTPARPSSYLGGRHTVAWNGAGPNVDCGDSAHEVEVGGGLAEHQLGDTPPPRRTLHRAFHVAALFPDIAGYGCHTAGYGGMDG